MDFEFNSEQFMMQDTVRGVLARNYDIATLRLVSDGPGFDGALWLALNECGIFGILVPEAFGGMGLSFLDAALVVEALGAALAPAPIVDTILAADLLARYGTELQKRRYLPSIANGKVRVSLALQEAEAGYDLRDIRLSTTVTARGSLLSGTKILVPNAAVADLLCVACRINDGEALALVLIDPKSQGVEIRQQSVLDLSSRYHTVTFNQVKLSEDAFVGKSDGMAVRRLFDIAAGAAALQATGIAARAFDDTVSYVRQREQFGKPIGSFQSIKHRIADLSVSVEGARSAAYYAAWALAEDAPDMPRAVSIAKSFCADTARMVCAEAIQCHGGIGFTWELGLHLWLRRAQTLDAMFGNASWHRERVVACSLRDLGAGG